MLCEWLFVTVSGYDHGKDFRPLNIAHIRYFLAAAEKGSYAGAAQTCFVTIQTISKAVSALEHSSGSALFVRKSTGVELTDLGHLFYDKAYQVNERFSELERLGEGYTQTNAPQNISLALSCEAHCRCPFEAENLLVSAFACGINLAIHSGSAAECLHAVMHHALDAAVVMGSHEMPGFEVRELTKAKRVALLKEGHPLATKDLLSVEDVCDFPLAQPPGLSQDYLDLLSVSKKHALLLPFINVAPTLEAHRSFINDDQGIILAADGSWIKKAYPLCIIRPFRLGSSTSIPLRFIFDPLHKNTSLEKLIICVKEMLYTASKNT